MKKYTILLALLLASCGYSSQDNELIAQVKKVASLTPILCFDHKEADLSLGVMRNGVGSMSTEDQWVYVENPDDLKLLQEAAESGQLVKLKYKVKRITWCVPDHIITHAELVK